MARIIIATYIEYVLIKKLKPHIAIYILLVWAAAEVIHALKILFWNFGL